MADHSRFHLDRDGHSVTVRLDGASRPAEVLVDGRVVARGRLSRAGTTVLDAELPGDPPCPLRVTLAGAGGEFRCEMEAGGVRHPVPRVPPITAGRPAPRPGALRVARRLLRRAARRAAGGPARGGRF
ncbi:hypothetical protein ACIPRL_06195 [Streptomyces sp. NPDC090085]|uniref:hypothetical protein n=1 Tax=unclassified Streptomyces TaxID=2593676 RepID=UPI00341CB6F7